jgi:hypothetical protein
MVSELIRWIGILMLSLLLFRGLRGRALAKYPFFYIYSACVFVSALLMVSPTFYDKWYWVAQYVTLIIGYGILLEILNHVLAPYPGAEKFARTTGLIAIGLIFCFALVFPLLMPQWSAGTRIEFERDLRTVQSIFICGLLGVISYYGIAIGKNMKGMITGYGIYIVSSLISLALRSSEGTRVDELWKVTQPLSYDATLVIWLIALWSYQPNPMPDPRIKLEADYEAIVARTRGMMGAMRGHLVKAVRP